jgi:hypothetical protein
MMAEDFSACAARIRVTFKQPVQPSEMQKMVESLMTRIALDCVNAGTRLIGHIKCIAEVEAGKYIACSVTTPDGKPRCSSSFGMASIKLEMVVNVLQYGLDKETIEGIVDKAAIAGFGDVSRVTVEDLDDHEHDACAGDHKH